MPASASGVSTQRSGPKRSRRPAVARKTPPAHDHDVRIALELDVKGVVDRLHERQLGHARPPK